MHSINQIAESSFYPASSHSTVWDYIHLLKPRLMSLAIFTSFVGMYMAHGHLHPLFIFVAILCISLGAGGAGALNMWYERETDAKMERTKNRPLPLGRVPAQEASALGMILSIGSVFILGLVINILSAFLLALTIFLYSVVYTMWLKPRTEHSIIIGGIAGALPPLIGWSAVTNSLSMEPLLLALIMFIWQIPHFDSLAIYYKKDYQRAKLPMFPCTRGIKATKQRILYYTSVLILISFAPFILNIRGWIYFYAVAILNVGLLYRLIFLLRSENERQPKYFFMWTIIYMFVLYLVTLLDSFVLRS